MADDRFTQLGLHIARQMQRSLREAVRTAAAGLLLLPSPLLLAPLVLRTLEPSQQLLVLIDVSGIDDLEGGAQVVDNRGKEREGQVGGWAEGDG